MFNWFRTSYWPGSIMRVNCSALLMMAFITYTLQDTRGADIPDQYTAQIEWLQDGENGAIPTSLKGNDVVLAYEDPQLQFFPLKIDEARILWQHGPGYTTYPLFAQVWIYDGRAELRYVSDYVALVPGQNIVDLGTLTRIDGVSMPAIFDVQDGPGFYLGVLYISDLEHEVWGESGHIVSALDGTWEGYNLVWADSEQQRFDAGTIGLPGNFGIRARFSPLCKKRVGDIAPFPDGDWHIDQNDLDLLTQQLGPDNVCGNDARQYLDLNGDCYLNQDDVDIILANWTGSQATCECQSISTVPGSIERTGAARTDIPQESFTITNASGGTLEYTVASEADWLTVSPNEGTSTGEGDEITLTYHTSSLLPGTHTGYIRIDANAGNSPYLLEVKANIRGNGDFDADGDVDDDDFRMFIDCATGPDLRYDPQNLPISCQMVAADAFLPGDFDSDRDIDMVDFGQMQTFLTGSTSSPSIVENLARSAPVIAPALLSIPLAKDQPLAGLLSVLGPRHSPKLELPPNITNYSLVVVIVVAILIVLALWALKHWVLDPLLRFLDKLAFISGGSTMGTGDANRIREALAVIESCKWHPQMNDIFIFLGQAKYANPETLGGFTINLRVSDDDETWIAVVLKASGTICVHQTCIRGRRWAQDGADGLAMVMIAEAQHMLHPDWDERQCQTQLEQFRREIPRLSNAAPHIHHGVAEGTR